MPPQILLNTPYLLLWHLLVYFWCKGALLELLVLLEADCCFNLVFFALLGTVKPVNHSINLLQSIRKAAGASDGHHFTV